MLERQGTRVDVSALLEAIENAPPVAAADVAADHLAAALGASEVSLLVADLGGKSLVRLSHRGAGQGDTPNQGREVPERVPIANTPQGRALTGQQVEVEPHGAGARVTRR